MLVCVMTQLHVAITIQAQATNLSTPMQPVSIPHWQRHIFNRFFHKYNYKCIIRERNIY